MKTKNDNIREAALAALLECNTLTEAAETAGIGRRTLYNLLHLDREFAQEYRKKLRERTIARYEEAHEASAKAWQTITEIMDDQQQPAAVRMKAAEKVLAICDEARAAAAKQTDDMASPLHFDF